LTPDGKRLVLSTAGSRVNFHPQILFPYHES